MPSPDTIITPAGGGPASPGCITLVFADGQGALRRGGNPLAVETPFGVAVVAGRGNAFDRLHEAEARADALARALEEAASCLDAAGACLAKAGYPGTAIQAQQEADRARSVFDQARAAGVGGDQAQSDFADALDPNATHNRRGRRLPHACDPGSRVREIPEPETCEACRVEAVKDADGLVAAYTDKPPRDAAPPPSPLIVDEAMVEAGGFAVWQINPRLSNAEARRFARAAITAALSTLPAAQAAAVEGGAEGVRELLRQIADLEADNRRIRMALFPFDSMAEAIARAPMSVRAVADTSPDDSPDCEVLTLGNGAGHDTLRVRHFQAVRAALRGEA